MDVNTVIDLSWLGSLTKDEFLRDARLARAIPGKADEIEVLLNTKEGRKIGAQMANDPDYVPVSRRQPDDDEAAQILLDTKLAEEQAAIDAGLAPPPIVELVVEPVVPPPPQRKTLEYQVTDENGNPIGRKTHIEYASEAELVEKMKSAHVNAVRYAERMKKTKALNAEGDIKIQQSTAQLAKSKQEAAEAVEAAKKDPALVQEAVTKSAAAIRDEEIASRTRRAHGAIIANAWAADHKDDFYVCDANSQLMGNYMAAHGSSPDTPLEMTYDNLELTFSKIKDTLAPVPSPAEVPAVTPLNPAPTAPVAAPVAQPLIPAAAVPPVAVPAIPVAAPVSQPSPAAPAPTSAAAPNAQPAARRPGVNGGLVPGSFSAERPHGTQVPQPTTRAELLKEIARMPRGEFAKRLKNANYVKKLEAAGIPYM